MTPDARFSLLLIGSNIDAQRNLQTGLQLLAERFTVLAKSPVYQSHPVGAPETADYLNQALIIENPPPFEQFRDGLRSIENLLGRRRSEDLNSPRTMDMDILAFADEDLQILGELPIDDALETFHHAAIPASLIAPEWRFPVTGATIDETARSLGSAPEGFLPVACSGTASGTEDGAIESI
jgi:2-amino-4-hydroxy-6-hydroxymethyldihydropteridine diphosphokinase